MAKTGRPRKEMDWKKFNELCQIHCTQDEIAAVLDVSVDTIDKRCKEEFNLCFSELYKQKRAGGRASLRHRQFQLAMDPDHKSAATLLIWLGKQWLGQTDQLKTDHSIDPKTLAGAYRIAFGDEED
jgi:hypothetical protein